MTDIRFPWSLHILVARQHETCFDDMRLSAEGDKYFDDMRLSTQCDENFDDMRFNINSKRYLILEYKGRMTDRCA